MENLCSHMVFGFAFIMFVYNLNKLFSSSTVKSHWELITWWEMRKSSHWRLMKVIHQKYDEGNSPWWIDVIMSNASIVTSNTSQEVNLRQLWQDFFPYTTRSLQEKLIENALPYFQIKIMESIFCSIVFGRGLEGISQNPYILLSSVRRISL